LKSALLFAGMEKNLIIEYGMNYKSVTMSLILLLLKAAIYARLGGQPKDGKH